MDTMIPETKEIIYLYCFTDKKPDLNIDTVDKIQLIKIKDLYAVFKYVSHHDYSEENIKSKISDILWLDKNVREHLKVITGIMNKMQVIPLNFGTIYNTEESLRIFVSEYYDILIQNMKLLENKEEWSVHVFCDKKILVNNIELFSEEIKEISFQIKISSPGKAYILEKKKNRMIEAELDKIYNVLSRNILSNLKISTDEWKVNPISDYDNQDADKDMIINAVFFIKNHLVKNFTDCGDKMNVDYAAYGITLEIKGPWPPYTFIKI